MADITASMVKDLREKSGAGMMDCKKALNETAGDMDAALDWLRTKGLAAAQKKSSRTAAEGRASDFAAYEVGSDTVSGLADEADARARLAVMLADQVVTRLLAALS